LVKVKGVVVGAHLYLLLIVLITNASKFVVIGLTTEKENFIELSKSDNTTARPGNRDVGQLKIRLNITL
jgi:hypothetical protein